MNEASKLKIDIIKISYEDKIYLILLESFRLQGFLKTLMIFKTLKYFFLSREKNKKEQIF